MRTQDEAEEDDDPENPLESDMDADDDDDFEEDPSETSPPSVLKWVVVIALVLILSGASYFLFR